MNENKISLTFVLPGRTFVSSQVCEKNPKESIGNKKIKGKGKKFKVTPVYVQVKKTKNAFQHLNISKESYLYMLNTPTNAKLARVVKVIKNKAMRAWDLLPEDTRLKHHFDLIAHDLNAISYSYEIIEE